MPNLITPLKVADTGVNVKSLHDAITAIASLPQGDAIKNALQDPGVKIGLNNEASTQVFGNTTKDLVSMFQKTVMNVTPTGVVDEATASAFNNAFAVVNTGIMKINFSGLVSHVNGNAVKGLTIRVSQKTLTASQPLNPFATTGDDGLYHLSIDYKLQTGTVIPAFIVEAMDKPNGSVVGTSAIVYKITDINVVNISVNDDKFRGDSLFAKNGAVLGTYLNQLKAAGPVKSISQDNVDFISNVSGLASTDVNHWLIANQLSDHAKLPVDVTYALVKHSNVVSVDEIACQTPELIKTAIYNAIAQNTIQQKTPADVDKIVNDWSAFVANKVLITKATDDTASLGDIIKLAVPDAQMQVTVLQAYINHTGDIKDFWDNLSKITKDDSSTPKLQLALKLATLTGYQPDVCSALMQDVTKLPVNIDPIASLAARSQDDWMVYLNELAKKFNKRVVPSLVNQGDMKIYAGIMANTLQQAFPTYAFLGRLENDTKNTAYNNTKNDIATFFAKNPTFDFKTTPTVNLLGASAKFNFDGVKDKNALVSDLRATQRLMIYTNDYATINKLKEDGLHTAASIVQMPKELFAEKYNGVMGSIDSANQLYDRAQAHFHRVTHFHRYLHENSNVLINPQPDPFGTTGSAPKNNPGPIAGIADADLRTMFGSLDACDCEDCISVFSAAAYHFDSLNWLKNHSINAYNELIRRRPDLVGIKVNCKNTNTPLPYIDLVNELLENSVQGVSGSYQTTLQPEELLAQPENLNYDAYTSLSKAVYPHVLPFNLPLEEVRVYLKHLGLKRSHLMQLFFKGDQYAAFNDKAIANERILLSYEEADIITGDNKSGTWSFYGFDNATGFTKPFVDPAGSGNPFDPKKNWNDILASRIDLFLQQAAISYLDLLSLLDCNFINPINPITQKRNISITALGIDSRGNNVLPDTCQLDALMLSGLVASDLEKIHRFIRLWRKIGWTMWELDTAIMSLSPGNVLDAEMLLRISQVDFICKTFKLPVSNALVFWSDISTASYTDYYNTDILPIPSLYEKLFYNSSITIPGKLEKLFPKDASSLQATGILLADDTDANKDYKAAILAALQISNEDYTYLTQDMSVLTQTTTKVISADNKISLSNISMMYRFDTLARMLGYSVKEILSIRGLIGIDPFSDTIDFSTDYKNYKPNNTYKFIQKTDTIKRSGFSLDQIIYLLYGISVSNTIVAPVDNDISVFLSDVLITLKPFSANLKTLLDAVEVDNNNLTNAKKLPDGTDKDAKLKELQTQLNSDQVKLDGIKDSLRISAMQKFSEKFKISSLAASQLLKDSANDFLDISFLKLDVSSKDLIKNINSQNFNALFSNYLRVDRAALVINKFKLTDSQLLYLLSNVEKIGCTNIADLTVQGPLPITQKQEPSLPILPTEFDKFEVFCNLMKACNILAGGLPDIYTIIDSAITDSTETGKKNWISQLAKNTNWDQKIITDIVGDSNSLVNGGMLQTQNPADFNNGNLILRINDAIAAINKLGLSTSIIKETILTRLDPQDSFPISAAIRNAAKAKYDSKQWATIARPLRDVLRDKQREALVAYLLANPDRTKGQQWKNTDEIYEYFLIDVEMKPIMLISRIKQATCSLQLFVDRILLNLENIFPLSQPPTKITLPVESVKEWKTWRCLYRIWEANKRIFYYPENWVDFTLLDLKSPFYKELETQLSQNELSIDNINDAFYDYAEKLDEVARLEIVGLYHQQESGRPNDSDDPDIDIMHVIGRTYNLPHKYYHRTLENGIWNAWAKIEVDMDGDHILPIIYNHRLCLFWLFFTMKSEDNNKKLSSKGVQPVNQFWNIQMGWTELKNNKWTAKRLSKSFVPSDTFTDSKSLDEFKKHLFMHHLHKDNEDTLNITLINTYPYDPYGLNKYFKFYANFVFNDLNDDPQTIYSGFSDTVNIDVPDYANNDFDTMMINTSSKNSTFILKMNPGVDIGFSPKPFAILNNATRNSNFNLLPISGAASLFNAQFIFQDSVNTFYVEQSSTYIPDLFKNDMTISVGTSIAATSGIYGGQVDVNVARQSMYTAMSYKILPKEEPRFVEDKPFAASPVFEIMGTYFVTAGAVIDKFNHTHFNFTFHKFHNPYVNNFIHSLNKNGVKGLLKRDMQGFQDSVKFENYLPQAEIVSMPDLEKFGPNQVLMSIDLAFAKANGIGDAYAQYHWELFFYAPMLIASRLSIDQRFEEARKWYHFVFNPTNGESTGKQRFWQFLPFWNEAGKTITTLDQLLQNEQEISAQINIYMSNPFQPHAIARLRISAYMKNVVMKYLDNIIAWADQLFRRDTIEAINEATNLYILSAKILGNRPQRVPARAAHDDKTVTDLLKLNPDDLSDPLVNIDTFLANSAPVSSGSGSSGSGDYGLGEMLYFCVPSNQFILKYWDTIADRLFKIRNSMNIEGIVRTLPLFDPPIDPAMLVRAAAAGIDLGSLLSDTGDNAASSYRFDFMIHKAAEICNEVKSLGSALLQALEKRDTEAIALLRSSQELNVLSATLNVKQSQLDDAVIMLANANKALEIAQHKYDYYNSRDLINIFEATHLASVTLGTILSAVQAGTSAASSVVYLIPEVKVGAPTSIGVVVGGSNFGNAGKSATNTLGITAAINNGIGSLAATMGGYARRMDDWNFQAEQAAKEIDQANNQILSATIKQKIAQQEWDSHKLQIDNNTEMDNLMKNKFTNYDLYDWMVGQISTTYFQSYQLAFDVAKKVEKCYGYELEATDIPRPFIKFGYWDSLKKGLLSAEKLAFDIKQMEMSYYDNNKRDYELTKHISIALLDPMALLQLKNTGDCIINIPEEIFDLDYPGHYFRRIKTVSLSIPCVAGSYTTISCTLTLMNNFVRFDSDVTNGYGPMDATKSYDIDSRFRRPLGIQSIAASSAQNDSGLFEVNFRDERYLPFEGAGAISQWRLQLPQKYVQFNYNTISDVIMHFKYTAREGGEILKNNALDNLNSIMTSKSLNSGANTKDFPTHDMPLMQAFSAKHDFPTDWYNFLSIKEGNQQLTIDINSNRFPYFTQHATININKVQLLADSNIDNLKLNIISPNLPDSWSPPRGPNIPETPTMLRDLGLLLDATASYNNSQTIGKWVISNSTGQNLNAANIDDLVLIFYYDITQN